jgi:hypothetical protein
VLGATAALALVGSPAGAASSDNTIEKRAVLKRTDFPAGWDSSKRSAPESSGIDVCAGIDDANDVLAPQSTRSPNFTKTDTDNVLANNSVVVLKSVKEAKSYLDPYRDDAAVRCLETLTETALTQANFAAVRVYVTPTDDVPSGADDAAGFDIQITVTSAATPGQPAQTEVIYQDYVFVRVGRALANFGFLNPGKSLPEQGELVDVVIGRLEDALAR